MEERDVRVIGQGYTDRFLTEEEVRALMEEAFRQYPVEGKRVIILIPDGTRTAPIPMMARLFREVLGGRVAALDFLIALGTHQPMGDSAIEELVGMAPQDLAAGAGWCPPPRGEGIGGPAGGGETLLHPVPGHLPHCLSGGGVEDGDDGHATVCPAVGGGDPAQAPR